MSDVRSLSDILADRKIRLKSQRPGHSEQIRCPKCDGGRTKELSFTVTIDQDGLGAVMVCHRGSCGYTDGARVPGGDRPIERERPIVKPRPAPAAETENRPQWFWDFWDARKIGSRTVKHFGVYATTRHSQTLGQNHPFIVFPYIAGGELANRKYRPYPEKQPQMQDRDALQTLFNVDALGAEPAEIVWVEGEPDVMALFECGIPHAVSLKDGAPAKLSENPTPNDKRFEALRTHSDLLTKAKRIVLAGDNDEPGRVLREELARRLGRHRCHVVEWPEGCKDAGDVLREHGPETVLACIQAAQPYPIEGLQRVKPGTLLALRRMPAPAVMTTGTRAVDDIRLRFPAEGRLIVVTGYPGSGKTSWVRFVMVHTATNHARRWAVFSPEMQPWEQFAASCAEVYTGRPFWPMAGYSHMSDADIADAEAWLSNRVTMLVCDAEDEAPTLDWVLERARAAVLRDGATDLLIDPWNEIDHTRPSTFTETEYTGRCLQRLKAFGLRHGCNVWVICHPAKPALRNGEAPAVPTAYAINGCYSSDTEVLTENGWMPHCAVTIADKVLCFEPSTGVLTYDNPLHIHKYEYRGIMHHYHGYSLDMAVTPNHRMVVQAAWPKPGKKKGNGNIGRPSIWSHNGWQFSESQDLKNQKYRMPMAGIYVGDIKPTNIPCVASQDAGWAFVGWYVSEGWMAMRAPAVCQADENSGNVKNSIRGLGLPFSERTIHSGRPNEKLMWKGRLKRVGSEVFCDWIESQCGDKSQNKRLPDALWSMDLRTKKIVFDALIEGDGHQRKFDPSRVRQGGCVYSTVSYRLAGDVQRLAIELGLYASITSLGRGKPHHFDRYQVTIGHPDRVSRVIKIPRNRTDIDYSGHVYCLTVPGGAYVTRRNGKMAICGNSAHWFNKADLGLTVHSTEVNVAEVHVWKARFRRLGTHPSSATIDYDPGTGRYKTPDIPVDLPEPARAWSER